MPILYGYVEVLCTFVGIFCFFDGHSFQVHHAVRMAPHPSPSTVNIMADHEHLIPLPCAGPELSLPPCGGGIFITEKIASFFQTIYDMLLKTV